MAARVLGNTGGAAVKKAFKIDTIKFSWIDKFLHDRAARNKIQALREKIKQIQNSPVHRDELRAVFDSALLTIKNDRLHWFVEMLKTAQDRQGAMVNSHTLQQTSYLPSIDLSNTDIENIFAQLPPGVKQADIDKECKLIHEEISRHESTIERAYSPQERWIYRDDGKPEPYPQGCRWTQYVACWEKVVTRFEGPVGAEGEEIESDYERTAYIALGLDKIARSTPLRKPISWK